MCLLLPRTLEWKSSYLRLVDQRYLPTELRFFDCYKVDDVVYAIKEMVVRGAPAIGVTAGYGVVIGIMEIGDLKGNFIGQIDTVFRRLSETRPTAVNLFWAIERMKKVVYGSMGEGFEDVYNAALKEAVSIDEEDESMNRKIGENGQILLEDGFGVLTHCNAGSLATSYYGTALGVIRAAVSHGKRIKVFADETRPVLQGARITAWELKEDGIPVTLITDNMAGYVMSKGLVNAVVVGADRIASNGDAANKIGTYSLSVLAKYHSIPFYVVAPFSSIDATLKSGKDIPIEYRRSDEVTHIKGVRIAPDGVDVFNPAFDVTPAENITAIITEKGIYRFPYKF